MRSPIEDARREDRNEQRICRKPVSMKKTTRFVRALKLSVFLLSTIGAGAEDWVQYRGDAGRSGYTSETVPAELALLWTYQPSHPPHVAWREESRLMFDGAFCVVADSERAYFGSSADGKVYALKAEVGDPVWAFFTGAPVRFAPILKKDSVLAVSDDGYLYCLSRRQGKLLWKRRLCPSDSMVLGNGQMISRWPVRGGPAMLDNLIDRPEALMDRLKLTAEQKKSAGVHRPGKLLALDAHTGEVKWKADEDIFGTVLAVSEKHDVLLMAYQPTRFRQKSEVGGRMAAFRASTGKPLWNIKAKYGTRPVLNDGKIYCQPHAYDLRTGKQDTEYSFKRSYGCGILSGGRNILLFRSATLGYRDLTTQGGTCNYGPARPGCWINAIPAGGLVLVPDASDVCSCSYLIKTSFALVPGGQ